MRNEGGRQKVGHPWLHRLPQIPGQARGPAASSSAMPSLTLATSQQLPLPARLWPSPLRPALGPPHTALSQRSKILVFFEAHLRVHLEAHTCTRVHLRANIVTMLTHTLLPRCAPVHTCANTHTHSHTHQCARLRIHCHDAYPHSYPHVPTYTCVRTHVCIHTAVCTHASTAGLSLQVLEGQGFPGPHEENLPAELLCALRQPTQSCPFGACPPAPRRWCPKACASHRGGS